MVNGTEYVFWVDVSELRVYALPKPEDPNKFANDVTQTGIWIIYLFIYFKWIYFIHSTLELK